MKRDKTKKKPAIVSQPEVPVTLEVLNQIYHRPIDVVLDAGGRRFTVRCRRLTPAEDAQVNLVALRALPPLVVPNGKNGKPDPDATPELDIGDAKWQAAQQHHQHVARALALYLGVPMFAAARPDLAGKPPEEVCAFIQGQLDEKALTTLYKAVATPEVRSAEAANFIWPEGSPVA